MFCSRAEPAPVDPDRGADARGAGTGSRAQRKTRRWAMTTQLTLHYTICTCVLLLAASAVLYWAIQRSLRQDDAAFLAHKMQVLTLILSKQPFDRGGLEQEVRDEAQISARSRSPYWLRVLTDQGRLVTQTPGMGTLAPPALFPSPRAGSDGALHSLTIGGKAFLLDAMRVKGRRSGGWRVQAALDTDADIDLLRRYRRDVTLLLGGGVLLAAALGAWITRRGLEPIAAITRTTQRIGAHRLQERVGPAAWPTELSALATEFDRMLERLEEAFGRLTQFSGDLAHELRTPLNNLMGESQVALAHERTPDEYVRVLRSALEEQARLARMIDSMLFLAQADQKRLPLERATLDARSELEAVAEFYRPLAQEQGVEVRCEGGGLVEADSLLLRRALSNLLSNALKHTSHGGCITLKAAAVGRETAVLTVSDSGSGIPAEHLDRLGERFYRADPSRTRGIDGAGLGLAIVRSIMVVHGGTFRIESRLGTGTTVSLAFPALAHMTIRSS